MAPGLSWAVLNLWPQLQLSSWSGLCGKEGQESESRTPMSDGGKWAGPVDRERRGTVTGALETDRPDKCGETPRKQGRDQFGRKVSILEGPHPGMQAFIHSSPK